MATATEEEIWHCRCKADRELADILVRMFTANVWVRLSKHFGEGYPLSLADKYDLAYRLIGCKGVSTT